MEDGQRGIEGFFAPSAKPAREDEIKPNQPNSGSTGTSGASGVDAAPKRARLPTLYTGPKAPTPLESFLAKGKKKAENGRTDSDEVVVLDSAPNMTTAPSTEPADKPLEASAEPETASEGWTCPRCSEAFVPPDMEEEDRTDWIARQRAEHEDWHFAADLQAQYGGVQGSASSTQGRTNGEAKKKKKPEGIKAFFAPKK